MATRTKLARLRVQVDRIDPYGDCIESEIRECKAAILDIKEVLLELIDDQIDDIDAKMEEEDGY